MVKAAIILAPDSSGLQRVFGTAAVGRLALLCRRVGIERVHVIARRGLGDEVAAQAGAVGVNEVGEEGGFEGGLRDFDLPAGEAVLVATANAVLDKATLRDFLEAVGRGGAQSLAAADGARQEVLLRLAQPSELQESIRSLWEQGVEEAPLEVRGRGDGGLPYALGSGPAEVEAAEARLVGALAAQTAADDGFMARHFDRRISRALSRRLSRTRITPNRITLTGVSIGLAGAYLLSLPHYVAQVLGSLLFLFCIVVDGVDGEVARLKLQESAFGHYLDVITDNLVHAAVFVGIAVGLYRGSGSVLYLYALWALLGGFVVCLVTVYLCILRRPPEELARSPRALRLLALLSNRDFAYLVVLLALIGRLRWFLLGAAVGTYVFAALLWAVSRREGRVAVVERS